MGRDKGYSPVELAAELEGETQVGLLFLRVLENGADEFPVEELIQRMEARPDQQERPLRAGFAAE